MKRKILTMALAFCLCLGTSIPAMAAESPSEIETAAAFLRARGIMLGDSNGDMQLARGLNRAELATLLTRLHGGPDINVAVYDWACYFPDVPAWAKPYVGYCVANLLMNGYGADQFGPSDPVNPAMACTVVLRTCGYKSGEGSTWSYATACSYAADQGLLSASTAQQAEITRGEMAVLIYRALQRMEEVEDIPVTPVVKPQEAVPTDPSGTFTITEDSWSREDFSLQANPAVFTDTFTRELYNVFRQSIVDIGTDNSMGSRCAYTMVSKSDYSAVKGLMGRLDGTHWLTMYVPKGLVNYYEFLDYFAVSAETPTGYDAVLTFLQPTIDYARGLSTGRERLEYLSDYLRTLLAYDHDSVAAMTVVFSYHSRPVQGACSTYAHAFNLLCQATDIPCFTIRTKTHSWNMVYVDGAWGHVDVSSGIPFTASLPNRVDLAPEATRFLKELLVPGSTK